jgi:hypothetical protein
MTPIQLIKETVDYYNVDPKARRGLVLNSDSFGKVSQYNTCEYITKSGKMCAIGRCSIDPSVLQDRFRGEDIYGLVNYIEEEVEDMDFDDLLMEEYKGIPLNLWGDLQEFHDSESNWNKDSLSSRGEDEYARLLKKWGDYENNI